MTATQTAKELDGLLEKVTKKTLHQNTVAKKPVDLVNNVMGKN